ncbi:hypothetical protein BZY95_15150 [Billgrantia desiderata SP1]|nr:hypothetical protein BZY95_15150 [Halomonas desiderata SP1]
MAAGHRFAADAAPSSAALATEATMLSASSLTSMTNRADRYGQQSISRGLTCRLEWTKLSQIKRPYEIWHSANANLCVEIRG